MKIPKNGWRLLKSCAFFQYRLKILPVGCLGAGRSLFGGISARNRPQLQLVICKRHHIQYLFQSCTASQSQRLNHENISISYDNLLTTDRMLHVLHLMTGVRQMMIITLLLHTLGCQCTLVASVRGLDQAPHSWQHMTTAIIATWFNVQTPLPSS